MTEDVGVVAPSVFQCVGQNAGPLVVEQARRQLSLFVIGRGQVRDGGSTPGGIEGDGAEGVAHNVSQERCPLRLVSVVPTEESCPGNSRKRTPQAVSANEMSRKQRVDEGNSLAN